MFGGLLTPTYLHTRHDSDSNYGSINTDDDMIEGYCLVFQTKTKYCQLYIEGNKLSVFEDLNGIEWNKQFKNMDNLLTHLEQRQIDYKILKSRDKEQKWIYVIIRCKESLIEDWAERHQVQVPIDPINAIKAGRTLPNFALAHHTKLDIDNDNDNDNDNDSKIENTFKDPHSDDHFPLLPKTLWNNIHIPFDKSLNRKIYKSAMNRNRNRNMNKSTVILEEQLYLRILHEMLVEDEDLGGANFKINKYFRNKYHPLKHFFALNQCSDKRPKQIRNSLKCFCLNFSSNKDCEIFCDDIRLYYGELIAFYFVFLIYYTQWLWTIAIIGSIWFIVEISFDSVTFHGSLIIVLITIIWATLMNQYWYRMEYKYRYKWGMLRYEQTQLPRSTFDGKRIVSTQNGSIIETYNNRCTHWIKMLFSISTMFFALILVISVVIGIWTLQSEYRNDYYLAIMLGLLNSLQIVIMNSVYNKFAVILNEWEGHRLQRDYYNNLVIKRITFTVVNYNYSLFYIAYWDQREAYNDNTVRLSALRMQLIILFLMAIFYQNVSEVVIPIIIPKLIKKCCKCFKKLQVEDDELISSRSLITESPSGPKINKTVLNDIKQQINLSKSPDILDNTAEIIVIHGYIMMFSVVFPIMPLLAIINNYIELKVDFYNLTNSQRPIPFAADGIGVWTKVIAVFNIIAIFSNLSLLTFRTDTITEIIGNNFDTKLIFFFTASIILIFVLIAIHILITKIAESTKNDIVRQELCQRELLHIARKLRK